MTRQITESIRLTEAAADESGLLEVEFITPGWGSSGYYSREVVEAAAPLFEVGTHMYFDHPSATENADRPERSVRDLAAVIVEAGAVNKSGGVVGKVRPLAVYRELLTDEAFAKNVGLSIRGSATDIVVGEAEGRQGPIIQGLAEIASVDFVTKAGRGGRVLAVLESAKFVEEATADDRARQLADAVRSAYSGPGTWAYVTDQDAEERVVWFVVSTDGPGPSKTYQQTYDVADNDVEVVLTGEPTEVRRLTQYVPVTHDPAGRVTNPTQESKEDTMPQIEEARLRQLEEAAGRVDTLESERDAATRRAEAAERELAESRAHGQAVTHARQRVTAANAQLPQLSVDRIVAEATRTVPLTESGQLDTTALDTAVDAARTSEETYLAGLAESAGLDKVTGFGQSTTANITESASKPTKNAWGRPLAESKGA